MSDTEMQALLHELQVRQLELELRNEALLHAQAAAQETADRYADLFDFAPVAYFVLDLSGVILRANRAGATLLGVEGRILAGQPIEQFAHPDFRPALTDFLGTVRGSEGKRSCELRLLEHGRGTRDVLAEGTNHGDCCRLTVLDITDRKRIEDEVQRQSKELRSSNAELAYFNRVMVDRELRMIELKKQVNDLCRRVGDTPSYTL